MTRTTTSALIATVVAAFLLASGLVAGTATSAAAWTTYTPNGGPSVNFVGGPLRFTNIPAAQDVRCTKVDLGGTVINPGLSRPYPSPMVSLTSTSSTGCADPLLGVCVLTHSGTWGLAMAGDSVSGVWPAVLTNVKLKVSCGPCTYTLVGSVDGDFAPSTFTPVTGPSGLTVAGGADSPTPACAVLRDIQVGDEIEIHGSWTNLPPVGSTPVTLTNP